MELNAYFKSLVDQDRAAVVICDLEHTIIYMNPAAIASYAKHGGAALLGKSVLTCHNPQSRQTIQRVIDWFAADKNHNLVYTYHNVKQNKDVYMVALRDADGTLIGYYEKHEFRSPETMERYAFQENGRFPCRRSTRPAGPARKSSAFSRRCPSPFTAPPSGWM